jgi:hypothetical protein
VRADAVDRYLRGSRWGRGRVKRGKDNVIAHLAYVPYLNHVNLLLLYSMS